MPNQRYNSHSIYEALPYLYMGGGVLVVVNLPNVWGIFSGLLLLSTGAWVWWIRWTFRRASRRPVVPLSREAAVLASQRDTGIAQLVWSKECECGNATIDTQRRKLFELGNALLNAILDEKPKLDVELLFDELVKDVANYFRTEENLLVRTNHLTTERQETHRSLLARCKDKSEQYHKDELKVRDLFKFVAREVLSEHILKKDLKFPTRMG